MALNTVLVLAASLGLAGPGQDPSLDTQIVAPVLGVSQAAQAATAKSQEKVTVQFRSVKASEVFSWLENKGVNFVIANGDISSDTTVTLNLTDVPLEAALNSLARALGGHWEKENGIRVFRKGEAYFYPSADAFAGQGFQASPRYLKAMPAMPKMPPMPKMPEMKGWDGKNPDKFFGPDFDKKWEKWSEEYSKQFEKQFGPEYQKKMEKMAADMQKQFGPEYQKKMEAWAKENGPQQQKEMERMGLEMQKQFGPEFQAKIKKMAQEAAKNGQTFKFEMKDSPFAKGDFKAFDKKEIEKMMRDAERARADAFRVRGKISERAWARAKDGKNADVFIFDSKKADPFTMFREGKSVDIKSFLRDLTPEQKDTQRKRGYIWWNDLTKEQKALLGDRPDGRFEISYKVNDEAVTIRGN